jgi:hypothetical protein
MSNGNGDGDTTDLGAALQLNADGSIYDPAYGDYIAGPGGSQITDLDFAPTTPTATSTATPSGTVPAVGGNGSSTGSLLSGLGNLLGGVGKAASGVGTAVSTASSGAVYNAQGQLVAIGGKPVTAYGLLSGVTGSLGTTTVAGVSMGTLLILGFAVWFFFFRK